MKKNYTIAIALLCLNLSFAQSVFINELHYDNISTDVNEGVEIAGPAGTDLSTYKIEFYNGGNGTVYDNLALAGIIPNQQNGFGTIWFARSGIQNGAPDGLALVNTSTSPATVIQFLSYEGSFTAATGDANGITSTDIGASENSSTSATFSLQLLGTGQTYTDFTWLTAAIPSSHNLIDPDQTFSATAAVHQEKVADFAIFPNPVSNGYFILNTKDATTRKVEIFDVLGKKVFDKTISGKRNQLNVSNLTQGIYILNVIENDKAASKKLLIK